MAIVDASKLLRPLFPSLTWQFEQKERVVYLTFDDGPHPDITPKILDILDRYAFKGTFFTVGENMERYPAVCERILAGGHAIGNHTYSHVSGYSLGNEEYEEEVKAWSSRYNTRLFRPPYGRITRRQSQIIGRSHQIIMWTLLSWDFQPGLDQERTLRKMRKSTRPGSIVVFHDSAKAEHNVLGMLPEYCRYLHNESYRSEAINHL